MEDDDKRPWHGHENPFEAIYAHFSAEIAKLKSMIPHLSVGSDEDHPESEQDAA